MSDKALQDTVDLVAITSPCGYFTPECAPPGCKRKHSLTVDYIDRLEKRIAYLEDLCNSKGISTEKCGSGE